MKKSILLFVLQIFILSLSSYSQTKSQELKWNNGYLEKIYKVNDSVILSLFSTFIPPMSVAVSRGKLEDGTDIRCNGIGDSTGRWHNFNGVGTIKQLKIPTSGITFCYYRKDLKEGILLGFKFEDDKNLPVLLHKLFKEKLKK